MEDAVGAEKAFSSMSIFLLMHITSHLRMELLARQRRIGNQNPRSGNTNLSHLRDMVESWSWVKQSVRFVKILTMGSAGLKVRLSEDGHW